MELVYIIYNLEKLLSPETKITGTEFGNNIKIVQQLYLSVMLMLNVSFKINQLTLFCYNVKHVKSTHVFIIHICYVGKKKHKPSFI